jgi:hypothetical protein
MSTRDDLLALLGDRGQGALVTLKRDGRPQLSNVGDAYDGSCVRVSITTTGRRRRTSAGTRARACM